MAATTAPPSDVAADCIEYLRQKEAWAFDPSSPDARRAFVPIHVLQRYFDKPRIERLLSYFHRSAADWRWIQSDYLAVFAVLITIDKGAYITHFTWHDHLADDRLPSISASDLPPDCKSFFPQFAAARWRFCAQTLRKGRLNEKRFPPETIIPITSYRPLKEGPDSSTYKVKIHPDYNQLADKDKKPTTNTFVLKTCRAKDAQHHESEVEAYKTLIHHHNGNLPNMARFYGSWAQDGRYNMLLEFVDGGSLEDFFRNNMPPTRGEDILKFWGRLFDVTKPVMHIHKLPCPENSRRYLQGIHHDIKASNILVSRIGPSPYDVVFKLADLGHADFAFAGQEGRELRRRDVNGAQTYSAPECFRNQADPVSKRKILDACPSKDIWSLGCVYSEAVIWSVWGLQGLEEFQNNRKAATDKLPKLRETVYQICFHDGEKVLQAVRNMHIRIRLEHRRHDYVATEVTPIIEKMLVSAESRPDANDVYEWTKQALETATECAKLDSSGPPESSYPAIFRKQPPQLPPEVLAAQGKIHFQNTQGMASADSLPSSSFTCSDPDEEEHSISSAGAELGYFAEFTRGTSRHSKSDQATYGNPSRRGLPNRPMSNPPPRKDDKTSLEEFAAKTNGINHRHSAPSAKTPGKGELDHIKKLKVPLRSSGSLSEKSGNREKLPHATISEAEAWIVRKKEHPNVPQLPGHGDLSSKLDGRDQIFLIDNSGSMKDHWGNVKRTFSTLAYLVKRMDPDGIEIRFTNARLSTKARSKDRDGLLALFESVLPKGRSDIALSLGTRILRAYEPKPYKNPNKLSSLLRKPKWGVNVYVLTDGVWGEGDAWLDGVVEPIKYLLSKGMALNEMGIQFIQFGDDKEGTRRLTMLDNELTKHGVAKDIIDTEPWTGNVYKMLLGSMDRAWDEHRPGTPDSPAGATA